MIKVTALDGAEVRSTRSDVLRIFAPKWWRIDRHIQWALTPKDKRAVVTVSFLGPAGTVVNREIRAIAE